MNDTNRVMKWVLVIGLNALALLALYPPSQKLKGGIDLVGGSSLLFEIDTTGLTRDEQSGLASRVMEVLKDRVDPQGQMNLEWRPVGNTRIEIRMPRPPKEAIERRKAKDAAFDAIAQRNLKRFDVEQALNAPPARRAGLVAALEQGVVERSPLLEKLESAFDAYVTAQAADQSDQLDPTRTAYEDAMSGLLATNLPLSRLADILSLGAVEKRETELAKLREEFPSFDTAFGTASEKMLSVAMVAYDAWVENKAELEDPSDLKRRIKGAGVLEFRILADRDSGNPERIDDPKMQGDKSISRFSDQLAARGPRRIPGNRYAWFAIDEPLKFMRADSEKDLQDSKDRPGSPVVEEYAGQYYVLAHDASGFTMLHGVGDRKWKLKRAIGDRDPLSGENVVSFTLNPRGGRLFGELTGGNIKRSLCIMMDNQAVSFATIQERITERCQISGKFSSDRVRDLVRTLEAGSLPARLKDTPLSEKTIGPSLGQSNRTKGISAATWAAIAVAVFVLFYYGIAAGGMANLALAMNLVLVLGIMATLQATFTLPGIAGLILTVGMAIDANVLIFERIKEERLRGVVLKKALNTGYDKAFSTIVDANLTTLITCIILGFVGSEEVKGFAITLGIGIVTSMFTSLFVTRLAFNTLLAKGMLKKLHLRSLIGVPAVNWMELRKRFWPVSIVLVLVGVGMFVGSSATDPEAVFDIEFLGGTGVQLDFKPGEAPSDAEVRSLITGNGEDGHSSAVAWLRSAADVLEKSKTSTGSRAGLFALTDPSKTLSADQLEVLMHGSIEDLIERDGTTPVDDHAVEFESKPGALDQASFDVAVADAVDSVRRAAKLLTSARVQSVKDVDSEGVGQSYEVVTIETDRALVQAAILATIQDKLVVQRAIKFEVVADELLLHEPFFVVESDDQYLRDVIGGDATFDIQRFRGGVVTQVTLDSSEGPIPTDEVERRIREIGLQLGSDQYGMRETLVLPFGDGSAETGYKQFAILAVDESIHYDDVEEDLWKDALARPHLAQVNEALSSEKSLSKVVQFAPQVAGEARNRAVFAIALAFGAIVAYLWLRFGTKEYGLAAIVALVHDVSITLGLVTACRFVAGTLFGDMLALEAFRVDLPMIAAVLTVIGYSLNDTIVVFDRIRENRGRIGKLSPTMINNSINQTLSRTLLTSITTFLAVAILYVWGGAGVHGFSFALMIGVIVGTYSSIGVATPLLYRPQLLRNVVTIIAALALIGITHLVVTSQTVEIVVSGLIVILCGVSLIRSKRTALTESGRPVAV